MGASEVHAVAEEETSVHALEADVIQNQRALVFVGLGDHDRNANRPRFFLSDVSKDRFECLECVRDIVNEDDDLAFHGTLEIQVDLDDAGLTSVAVRADLHELHGTRPNVIVGVLHLLRLDGDRQIRQEHEPAPEQANKNDVLTVELAADLTGDAIHRRLDFRRVKKSIGHKAPPPLTRSRV